MPTLMETRVLPRAEQRRVDIVADLNPKTRAALGQFMTPPPVAALLASLFDLPDDARLLDAGAGVGSLSAAMADRWASTSTGTLDVTAVEMDPTMLGGLAGTIDDLAAAGVKASAVAADFVQWGVERIAGFEATTAEPYDLVVMNPPYGKLAKNAGSRRTIEARLGVDVPNMYAAFVTVAIRLLRPGGQLVAITPRSFANGPYFRAFRRDLLGRTALRNIHVYDTRDSAFADDDVLQENVVFRAVAGGERDRVVITSSADPLDSATVVRDLDYADVVDPADPEQFVHLTTDDVAADLVSRMRALPSTLAETGITISTGRVVDFRTRENLRPDPEEGTVPLVYPSHFAAGRVRWPIPGSKKPNALLANDDTASLLLPSGHYVLTKRFTAKEERRRVVAVVADPEALPGEQVAFENHVNVFHASNRPLEATVARGLSTFLNSTLVDRFFRQWSGHTQVNATDLRSLRYPTVEQLAAIGAAVGELVVTDSAADAVLVEHVPELSNGGKATLLMAHQRVTEAQQVLADLDLPKAQRNERSALTLLALLNLTPDKTWADVEAPMLGITEMMGFMADAYGKKYAPNTRETVRRQTVHQFVQAGVLRHNPDDPTRPTNSGKNVYQVAPDLLDALKTYGTKGYAAAIAAWNKKAPGLAARWAKEREMSMIPVTAPDGSTFSLSAGGQNPLIKEVVEQFLPRFAPGAQVLYIGDAGEKFVVWEKDALAGLGLTVDEHGKMPDVVALDTKRDWLLLIEATTSHGPVDAKRHEELATLFGDSTAGLVYVTTFIDKASFKQYCPEISWETEVWIAEAPTHMIHFNGERFLGPYDAE